MVRVKLNLKTTLERFSIKNILYVQIIMGTAACLHSLFSLSDEGNCMCKLCNMRWNDEQVVFSVSPSCFCTHFHIYVFVVCMRRQFTILAMQFNMKWGEMIIKSFILFF
jgi:hypothetical protein